LQDADKSKRFYEVIWPHAAAVLRTARVLAGRLADAEDLAQETLLKAFKSLDLLREGSDAKAWLMAILRNARIDRARAESHSARDVSLEQMGGEVEDRSTQVEVDGADGRRCWEDPEQVLQSFGDEQMIAALRGLPDDIRWTLLLVDVEGINHADAAEVLQVPEGTIKSRVHRGRAMLRQALLPLARELRMVREQQIGRAAQ
jgi:RNA polymerase sigma-70 factor (ECF subfamily)